MTLSDGIRTKSCKFHEWNLVFSAWAPVCTLFVSMHRLIYGDHSVSHYFNIFIYLWKSHDVTVTILQSHMACSFHSVGYLPSEQQECILRPLRKAMARTPLRLFVLLHCFRIMFFHAPAHNRFRISDPEKSVRPSVVFLLSESSLWHAIFAYKIHFCHLNDILFTNLNPKVPGVEYKFFIAYVEMTS